MKIFIMGVGRMGAWLSEELCHQHQVAVYDCERTKMKYLINVKRLTSLAQVAPFKPHMVINAVTAHNTIAAFEELTGLIPAECLLADIASVKAEVAQYYQRTGRRFVSTHPMFGPTFSNIRDLRNENAIIITESDPAGKEFFQRFFYSLQLNIYEYTFEEHDRTTAYSLGTPFASSLTFAANMKPQKVPGTTFRKHLEIVRGLLSEDDYLLSEVLFNPCTLQQIEHINSRLAYLTHIIRARDYEEMKRFLDGLRKNVAEVEKST